MLKPILKNTIIKIKDYLPLIVVVLVAVLISIQNIDFNTYYSGWDNIHAEFNLARYARQVFFGSWLEHQGLGAPAAQGHLAEIPRLPILWLLQTLLPNNLVRYIYIFTMYLIGGIGVYLFLGKIWLQNKAVNLKKWLASLGAIFYLLHLLTLQQYYISFELFMVQFAFFPFLLILLHRLSDELNTKNILYFVILQLLLAPSGHTPTVFYLGVCLSLLYAFFIKFEQSSKNCLKALKFSFIIGLLTLAANAYWILPNLYYSFNNSHYVAESRTNSMFAPESLWSIKEAATPFSFFSGMHYLFNWKDYSFQNQQFEFVFNEWQPHLSQPITQGLIYVLGVFSVSGLLLTIFDKKIGAKKWAIAIFYLCSVALIWIELFPTAPLVNFLFENPTFLEIFRKPFTKLSILYSFIVVVFFVQTASYIIELIENKKIFSKARQYLAPLFLGLLFLSIFYVAWPSFQGHFISDKLQIEYPDQYFAMFDYLQTRDKNLRILPLPQYSHAAWAYHDWSFLKPGNGYQGMGFYFFGIPQPILMRDFDRWVETNDFFFHELEYAMQANNVDHFSKILEKYNVDLILVDESKIDTSLDYDYQHSHQLASSAGLNQVWQDDFLTIYERDNGQGPEKLIAPNTLKLVSANTRRLKRDYAYHHESDYILVDPSSAYVTYPLLDLTSRYLDNVDFDDNSVSLHQEVKLDSYTATLPGLRSDQYQVPAEIRYQDNQISVQFPRQTIAFNDQVFTLPKLRNFQLYLDDPWQEIILFFGRQGIVLNQGQTVYPVIDLEVDQPFEIFYAQKPELLHFTEDGTLPEEQLETYKTFTLEPDWSSFKIDRVWQFDELQEIRLKSEFPTISIDINRNPTVNCSEPHRGEITAEMKQNTMVYQADNYAVACSGYDFEQELLTSAYSYITRISGSNIQGRSIKFFAHFPDDEFGVYDYVLPEDDYEVFLTLNKISSDPRHKFVYNWETRSFGKQAVNQLHDIQLAPIALNQFAQLRLESRVNPEIIENSLKVYDHSTWLGTVHKLDVDCAGTSCYLGLDQSYDDLWLALNWESKQFLPHLRFNDWANIWQLENGRHTIIKFYLPELVVFAALLGLGAWLGFLLIKTLASSS